MHSHIDRLKWCHQSMTFLPFFQLSFFFSRFDFILSKYSRWASFICGAIGCKQTWVHIVLLLETRRWSKLLFCSKVGTDLDWSSWRWTDRGEVLQTLGCWQKLLWLAGPPESHNSNHIFSYNGSIQVDLLSIFQHCWLGYNPFLIDITW